MDNYSALPAHHHSVLGTIITVLSIMVLTDFMLVFGMMLPAISARQKVSVTGYPVAFLYFSGPILAILELVR